MKCRSLAGRSLLWACLVALGARFAQADETVTTTPGPFKPDWPSLHVHQDPEWFRDAKFGIYTHWGPVTVGCEDAPQGGEWYGREMYLTNDPIFAWHRQKFGDQHTFGYKDVIPRFTAPKFDPEKWADLFARAGAKFAGPVAVHHDNFAMWDSAVTPWNSMKMGPKRDITGELAKAYRARGLKLITTFHHGFAWRYYEPAFQFDAADGRNFQLYTEPHGPKDPPSWRFQEQWLAMVMEVVRQYEPDMIWFDFELNEVITPEYQRRMFADYYNWAAAHGKESAVAHKFRELHQHTGILDFERGREDRLAPYPWLTDTALGPWFNRKADPYRPTGNLIQVLADIVAKNGCLLLNVGPNADGSIPERAQQMLLEMGAWLKVNGEAIYGTRPWLVYGEGPTRSGGGGFSEGTDPAFNAQDIRFTTKGDALYAISLGWPEGEFTLHAVCADWAGADARVELLGHGLVPHRINAERQLVLDPPTLAAAQRPCQYAFSFKLTGFKTSVHPSLGSPSAMKAADLDANATLGAVARYSYGDDRKALHALQELVLYANSLAGNDPQGFRGALADRMAVLLTSPEATPAAKVFVCGQLAAIATEKQAPAVTSLLTNQPLVAAAALRALERIPGSTVDRELRDALGTLAGELKIGVVAALGSRRDRAATEPLIAMLAGADQTLAGAAADALGQIGGDAAARALQQALGRAQGRFRSDVAAACLTCAERLLADGQSAAAAALYTQLSAAAETQPVRMAALRGAVRANPERGIGAVCAALTGGDPALESMALQLVPEVSGTGATEQMAQCVARTSGPVQALLLDALAARGDVAARGAVQAAVSSEDPAVRIAALNALGTLGDETSVKTLADRTVAGATTAEGQAARNSLVHLRGPRVNEALTGLLSGEAGRQSELIRVLVARNAVRSLAALEKAAEAEDGTVRKEAWKALGSLARSPDVASLLALLVRVRGEERDEAEHAVAAVLKKPDRPDLSAALQKLETVEAPAARASLIRVVSAVGDDRALPALRKAVQSGDAGLRDAAVRGLAAWPTPTPLEDLVSLARTAPEPVQRVLALRAAIRLSSEAMGRAPEQTTRLVTELMQLAGATAERSAVLAALGRCPTPEALRLAQHYLADPELTTEAGAAVTQIASALRDTHRDQALAALQQLLAGHPDPAMAARAVKMLKDLLNGDPGQARPGESGHP